MAKERTFKIVYIQPGKSNGIDSIPTNVRSIHYNGSEILNSFKKNKIKQIKSCMKQCFEKNS